MSNVTRAPRTTLRIIDTNNASRKCISRFLHKLQQQLFSTIPDVSDYVTSHVFPLQLSLISTCLRLNSKSLSSTLLSTYLMYFCFLSRGCITLKKLFVVPSLAALNTSNLLLLFLQLLNYSPQILNLCSEFWMFVTIVTKVNTFTWSVSAFVFIMARQVTGWA